MPEPATSPQGRWRALHPHELSAGWWYALAAILVVADYATGPHVQFGATFVVPVVLTAWYSGLTPALILAVALPLIRLAMVLTGLGQQEAVGSVFGTTIVWVAVFAFLSLLLARLAEHERALEAEVAALEGLLPICMHCKRIRNEAGEWEQLEMYITSRTDAVFSHGVCAPCADQHYRRFMNRPAKEAS